MTNPAGWDVSEGYIEKIEDYENSVAISHDDGWTFIVDKSELNGFIPQVGQSLILYTSNLSIIRGITIDGHVIRYVTREQAEQERIKWLADYERKKIECYNEMKDEWQSQVEKLHPTLQKRIRRFEAEKGAYEFWKEDGGYEMYAMTGANALINKAQSAYPGDTDLQVQFIDSWWKMNTAEGGYDYAGQIALIPEFGSEHSGNTAGAAYSFARAILTGEYSEYN